MKKLKINLFVEGIKISELLISDEWKQDNFHQFKHLNANSFNETIQSDLFTDFLETTKREIISDGLSNTYKNQIEIWYGGKKINKLKIADLNPQYSLFPLYQTTATKFSNSNLNEGIYCEEQEIGLIACYETALENFDIEELVFETKITETALLLCGLTYKEATLNRVKSDILLTSQFYFQSKNH